MPAQPYTAEDLAKGEQIVRELHGLKGFEAWAERVAKVIAAERERCAKIAERIGAELREHAVGGAIADAIRNEKLRPQRCR